jgi:iron complex transport system substrate-binding protein
VIIHVRNLFGIGASTRRQRKSQATRAEPGRLSRLILSIGIAATILGLCSCSIQRSASTPGNGVLAPYRIVSFAPSITETLFALGLGDRVVGVTRFCLYPPEARKIPKVGGYVDPNFEMILGLKPDLVLTLKEHGPLLDFLNKNKIRFQVIENERLDEIISSFSKIGELCGVKERGDSIASQIRAELGAIDSASRNGPKVLFCIGRENPGSGQISKLFAAGPKSFYQPLITASGGTNSCSDLPFAYPELSIEGIIRMQPEVVIDIMPSIASVSSEKTIADWNCQNMVPAVRSHCVYCLTSDYATIPGPRIVLLLRDMRRIVAEAKWRIRGRRSAVSSQTCGGTDRWSLKSDDWVRMSFPRTRESSKRRKQGPIFLLSSLIGSPFPL